MNSHKQIARTQQPDFNQRPPFSLRMDRGFGKEWEGIRNRGRYFPDLIDANAVGADIPASDAFADMDLATADSTWSSSSPMHVPPTADGRMQTPQRDDRMQTLVRDGRMQTPSFSPGVHAAYNYPPIPDPKNLSLPSLALPSLPSCDCCKGCTTCTCCACCKDSGCGDMWRSCLKDECCKLQGWHDCCFGLGACCVFSWQAMVTCGKSLKGETPSLRHL